MTAPTSTARLASNRGSQRESERGAPTASIRAGAGVTAGEAASLIADSGIYHGIEQIDGEVDQDIGGGGHEHHPLHHRVVSAQDGGDDETAEPGDIEHDLRHHRPADEHRRGDADDG